MNKKKEKIILKEKRTLPKAKNIFFWNIFHITLIRKCNSGAAQN